MSDDDITYDPPGPINTGDEPAKNERAVAMEFDEDRDDAPRVTAKGAGEIARHIQQLAEENDVPIYEDPDLVELLYGLDLDETIPPELYEVVAEVFAFVYRLNQEQDDST